MWRLRSLPEVPQDHQSLTQLLAHRRTIAERKGHAETHAVQRTTFPLTAASIGQDHQPKTTLRMIIDIPWCPSFSVIITNSSWTTYSKTKYWRSTQRAKIAMCSTTTGRRRNASRRRRPNTSSSGKYGDSLINMMKRRRISPWRVRSNARRRLLMLGLRSCIRRMWCGSKESRRSFRGSARRNARKRRGRSRSWRKASSSNQDYWRINSTGVQSRPGRKDSIITCEPGAERTTTNPQKVTMQ